MQRHEWRVLPGLRSLPDEMGRQVFLWLHVPLFLLVFLFSLAGAASPFAVGLSVFAIIHVGLHVLFRTHPAYEFNNPTSWALILLTGIFGAVHLGLWSML